MRDEIVSKRCGFKRKSNVKQDLQRTGKRVRIVQEYDVGVETINKFAPIPIVP